MFIVILNFIHNKNLLGKFSIIVYLALAVLVFIIGKRFDMHGLFVFILLLIVVGIANSITESLQLILCQFLVVNKRKNTICIHGVKGGNYLDNCECCLEEKKASEEADRKAKIAVEERKKIKVKADKLKSKEVERLSKHQLRKLENLLKISPQEFEDIVATMYRNLNYSVKQTPYSNDKGKDAIAWKDGKKYLIECKRYGKDKNIGRPHLQKFYAAIIEENAYKGFFITTSGFASTAPEYVADKNIELINGRELVVLMQLAFPENSDTSILKQMCLDCGDVVVFNIRMDSPLEKECNNNHLISCEDTLKLLSPKSVTDKSVLDKRNCPKCGKNLRIVRGRNGKFRGCSGYPNCKYTENY